MHETPPGWQILADITNPKMQSSVPAVTAAQPGVKGKKIAHVSFSHVLICQMSHSFSVFLDCGFRKTHKLNLAHT